MNANDRPGIPTDSGDTVLSLPPAAAGAIEPGALLLNTFRVERLLGGGGMGEVYLARHVGLGTRHAIKVIRPTVAKDPQVRGLFQREARVLRGVRHEAVVSYDGFMRDDRGRDYLVMEYVEGPSLAERLRRGPLSSDDVLTLRERLAAGLAEAHRNGAVHRDLSPDNIILPADRIEFAKLIDFGICKLTDPAQETIIGSAFAGKYRYASPEQLGLFGGQVDARSDIYSLGLVLAAAALGHSLPMGETVEAALRSRQTVPDLASVDPALRDWLTAMLQPDPGRRPASLLELLEHWPAGTKPQGVKLRKIGSATSTVRRAMPWILGLASLVVAAGSLFWTLRPITPAPTPGHQEPAPLPSAARQPDATEKADGNGPKSSAALDVSAVAERGPSREAERLRQTPNGSGSVEDKRAENPEVPAAAVVPGTRFSDPLRSGGFGPTMIWLAPGEFQMGSPAEEGGRNADEQLHSAVVAEPIAVGETEITVGQFRAFVRDSGYRTEVERESTCLRPDESWQRLVPDMSLSWESPGYAVTDDFPVACISWNDAQAYARWMTTKSGHPYRLPTESEWEYAARGGTLTSRYWGDDPKMGCRFANTADCKGGHAYATSVATLAPNPFGLRDMLGNLAEWTCSGYGKGYSGGESRCSDTGGSSPKVFRGGSWLDAPGLVRSAARDGAPANVGLNTVGFRLVRPWSS